MTNSRYDRKGNRLYKLFEKTMVEKRDKVEPLLSLVGGIACAGLFISSFGLGFAKGYNSSQGIDSSFALNSSLLYTPILGSSLIGYGVDRHSRTYDHKYLGIVGPFTFLSFLPLSFVTEGAGFGLGYLIGGSMK